MPNTPPAPETTSLKPGRGLEVPDDVQTEARTVTDRALFDKIQGKYNKAPKKPDDPAPSAPPPTDSEPQRKQAAEPEKPESKPKEPSAPRPEVAAAKQFLKLKTKVPQSMLDAMTDADALEWAEERRGRESTVDAAFARAKRAETADPPAKDDPAIEPKEPARPTLGENLKVKTKALAEELALTDDGRARLDDVFDEALAPIQKQLDALVAAGMQTENRFKVSLVDVARQQAGKRFPGLSEDADFEKVLQDATALENTDEFAGSGRSPEEYLPELFERVARGRGFAEANPEKAESERVAALAENERQERVDHDAGSGITSRPTEARQETGDEADWRVFQTVSKAHGRAM